MNCWHCGSELIWGGDHDIEDSEDYDMVTNLSCHNCGAYVEVYRAITSEKKQRRYGKMQKNQRTLLMLLG